MLVTVRSWLVAAATLLVAHGAQAAQVIVAPVQASAPVLGGLPMLLLSAALAAAAIGILRRGVGRAAVTAAAVLGAITLGTAGFAVTASLPIDGEACTQGEVLIYPDDSPTNLLNLCPNPMKIVSIDPCTAGETEQPAELCTVGQVLAEEAGCLLPSCGD